MKVTAKLVSTVKAEMASELMDRSIEVKSCRYISCWIVGGEHWIELSSVRAAAVIQELRLYEIDMAIGYEIELT